MPIQQDGRPIVATTPLGGDALVAVALSGEEAVSRPFLFTVDFVASSATVDASSLLGQGITVSLPLVSGEARALHGVVRRFVARGKVGTQLWAYRAELVPALWFLSLSSDCRTFENQSPLDIVETVLRGAGVTDFRRSVTAVPAAVPYVVQYRETNLAFVTRLLEEAGLYYYFEFADGAHTLVFSDKHGTTIPACSVATLPEDPQAQEGRARADSVFALSREKAVHQASVALADHDLLRADSTGSATSPNPGATGEWYDFLGDLGPNESATLATRWIEADEAGHDLLRGSTNCAAMAAGTRVALSGPSLGSADLEVHVLSVRHEVRTNDLLGGSGAGGGPVYEAEFTAIPATVKYRPPRRTPTPSVQGTQTAKVVGTGGSGQIDVDANGAVLLQFPWDRGAGKDGASQHRVHVASLWAGTQWGFVQLPRVGQEVLVEFLEGDPARPIVTGRVYNSAHKPPYALPADKTQSGWKSRTLGGGTEDFNELRFEDKQNEEHVYLQAQKDLQILVKHDRTALVRHLDEHKVEALDDGEGEQRFHVVKGPQTMLADEGAQKVQATKGDQTIQASEGVQLIAALNGEQKLIIDSGPQTIQVKSGAQTINVDDGDQTNTVSGTSKTKADTILLEADTKIELKVGQNTLTIESSGITIKVGSTTKIALSNQGIEGGGTQVKLEGTGQLELKGAQTKVEGSGMLQMKGAMAELGGDAMLTLKGGVTMIN